MTPVDDTIPPDEHEVSSLAPKRQAQSNASLGGGTRALLVASLVSAVAALGLSGAALITTLNLQRQGVNQSIDFASQARAFIESHPEVIVDSLNQAEARNKKDEAKEAVNQLVARNDEIFSDPAAPVGGNSTGDATLVEFFDYNCHFCKAAAPVVEQLKQADPNLKIVFKEFPILGPGSVYAARAALASQKQGKFVPFHDALYAARGPINESTTLEIAAKVGLDVDRLKADMADPAIDEAIKRNIALAEALHISGMPTFVSRKDITPGLVNLDTLKQMIAEARKT